MNSDAQDTLNRKMMISGAVIVFLASFIAYFRTVAPTTSFWDCGEFIACSYILGVMHPPGAPLYLLIGRILTMIPLFEDIGLRINVFSVFISAVTISLTFLVIVQLIRRWRGEAKTWEDRVIMYVSGIFGALAFAFTDSQWFNSVEAEVYALSMFFTALVVWLALHWGERSEKAGSMLLIFFVFYMFGLATGVHLLNILVFPFVLLIAFFHHNERVRRLLVLITVQAIIPILAYMLLFQYNPDKMSYQEILAHQGRAATFLKYFGLIWIAATLFYIYRKDRFVFKAWWILPLIVLVGYSTYLIIYIRANLAPPINENDPSTLEGMMDYLARKQYGTEDLMLTFLYRKAAFWQYQIQFMYTRYFGWQFIGKGATLDYHDRIIEIISFRGLYGLPFLIGLWGAVHHFFRDWKRALAVLVLFLLTGYAIIIYLNQPDPQPRERDYSYVGSFFAFALWIGIGMAGVLEWVSETLGKKLLLKKITLSLAAVVLFVAVPLNLYAFNSKDHSRAGNYVAYDYSYNILESCEPNAILFTNGDNDTFPLWFLQEVYGIRKDVRVINLSLLNTGWYIRQLQDQEPRVPIQLRNEVIDNLFPREWQTQKITIPVPEDVQQEVIEQNKGKVSISVSDSMVFTLEPTFKVRNYGGIRVQDLMVLRILQKTAWKRPVYFAVTVSRDNLMGMDDYLRMDGLVFKVVPYKTMAYQLIHPDVLRTNILEKYKYRGLDDPDVYFNVSIIKLLQNYRSAFRQLALYYVQRGLREEAGFILDEMSGRIPEDHIPYASEHMALIMADLYKRIGRSPDMETFTDHVLDGIYRSEEDKVYLANFYATDFQEYNRAQALLQEVLDSNPRNGQAIYAMYQVLRMSGEYQKAIPYLENLVASYPRDENLRREFNQLKRLAAMDTSFRANETLIEEMQ